VKGRDLAQTDPATDNRVRGNSAQNEGDTWAQSHTDHDRRRLESSLVRPNQRTAQRPSSRLALHQLNGNGGAAVRHDADRGVPVGGHDPKAPDEGVQRVGRLVELNLRAMDQSAADAHPSDSAQAASQQPTSPL
jgi:hypothetical protein